VDRERRVVDLDVRERRARLSQGCLPRRLADAGANYDVVLLDRFLGDGDGTGLLPILRARLPEARALLISGEVDLAEAEREGFDAAIVKGVGFEEVVAILGRFVRSPDRQIHDTRSK
jgi:response regulator of citrate/malate metabolism